MRDSLWNAVGTGTTKELHSCEALRISKRLMRLCLESTLHIEVVSGQESGSQKLRVQHAENLTTAADSALGGVQWGHASSTSGRARNSWSRLSLLLADEAVGFWSTGNFFGCGTADPPSPKPREDRPIESGLTTRCHTFPQLESTISRHDSSKVTAQSQSTCARLLFDGARHHSTEETTSNCFSTYSRRSSAVSGECTCLIMSAIAMQTR